jgi:hypothetical protein
LSLRRDSIAGAKKCKFCGLVGWLGDGGVADSSYFRAWTGAPQSKDMNASHGRLSELKPIIRNESRILIAVCSDPWWQAQITALHTFV